MCRSFRILVFCFAIWVYDYTAQRGSSVDELVAVMVNETVLVLTDDDLQDKMENTGSGLFTRLCVSLKYPRRDGFTKVLKRIWGDCIAYTELGHTTMVVSFATDQARDLIIWKIGPWFFKIWVILVDRYEARVPISQIWISKLLKWVHFYKLPLDYFSWMKFQRVAPTVGKFIKVAFMSDDQLLKGAEHLLVRRLW